RKITEPKFEDIFVHINGDDTYFIQLPVNKTLNEIRILLSNEPNIRMGSKMYFMIQTAKILQNDECKHLLSKILDNNNLNICGEQELDLEEPIFRDINVQRNDDTTFLIPLPINKTLTEIRHLLAIEKEIRMDSKMYFGNPFAKISQNYEGKYLLKAILDSNNHLKIIGDYEPNWEEIKVICKLAYGVDFSETGPKYAEKKAFDITTLHLSKLAITDTLDEIITCRTKSDKICAKNLITNFQVTANLLWSSISATLKESRGTEKHTSTENSTTYKSFKRIKAEALYIEAKPTEEFKKAVENALAPNNPHNKLENLEKVAKEYGPLYCKKLGIGGRILVQENKEGIAYQHDMSRETNASGRLEVTQNVEIGGEAGKSQQTKKINSSVNENSFFRMFGGLNTKYHGSGMSGWVDSLNNYQNWAVAEYTEINSVFDILDPGTRSRIAELSKRIVESEVVELTYEIADIKPYTYYLPSNLQLSNTDHIFVTVMKEDESKNLFAARVHYIDEKSRPIILIHHLKPLKAPKFITLKLGLIVIGTPTLLDLAQPVFESKEIEIEEIEIKANDDNKRLMATINQKIDSNSSLLATCVSREEDPKNLTGYEYIAGTHFVYKDDAIKACAFCYKSQKSKFLNKEELLQIKNMPIKLSVNYSIIAGTGKHQFGKTKIISESLSPRSKCFKVSFDDYPRLIEQSVPPPVPLLNEKVSLSATMQRTLQNPVFISLILGNCPKDCVHGFFNITPNHAMFRSLKNSFTEDGQIVHYLVGCK
ncbi:8815_t:CDS:2, partial [Ambispora leptoticha]